MLCSETQASANHRIILSRTGYLQGFSLHLQISSPAPQINITVLGTGLGLPLEGMKRAGVTHLACHSLSSEPCGRLIRFPCFGHQSPGAFSTLAISLIGAIVFWPYPAAYGILVPRPGIEPKPSAVRSPSPNHWTAREILEQFFKSCNFSLLT